MFGQVRTMLGSLFYSPLIKQENIILLQNEMFTVEADEHYMEFNLSKGK
jgi:hypothetical protein